MKNKFIYSAIFAAINLVFAVDLYADTEPRHSVCERKINDSGKFLPIPNVHASQLPIPDNGALRLTADDISGHIKQKSTASGNVIVEKENYLLNAASIDYDREQDAIANNDGFVIKKESSKLVGESLTYNLNTEQGVAKKARMESNRVLGRIQAEAEEIHIFSKQYYRLKDAVLNTCDPTDDSWYFKAKEIDANLEKNIGVARNVSLVFKGVPILYSPWLDFPLNGNRKSGFLAPIIGGGTNGFEIFAPYYLNLAANYDATVALHYYSRRGLGIYGETRYLQPSYSGSISADWLPRDHLKNNQNRNVFHASHRQQLGNVFFGFDYNRASDNDYFRDLGNRIDSAENIHLLQKAWINYSTHIYQGQFNSSLYVQQYQTLQDELKTIDEPYKLEPRLEFDWKRYIGSAEVSVLGQFSRFGHSHKQTGSREVLYPNIKWNLSRPWGYVKPKMGLHMSMYQVDTYNDKTQYNGSRVLPILSTEMGLNFEREQQFKTASYIQTLEPKLFYTYIPTKQQNELPNFDSTELNFSYDQLFRENRFTGHDRINSAHSLSTTLMSTLINQETGVELFRAGLGQRFYFKADDINLAGRIEQRKKNRSDFILFANGRISNNIYFNNNWHYDENTNQTKSFTTGIKYSPQVGKTLSLRFGYDRESSYYYDKTQELKYIDVAMQWPIKNQYYVVARQNYSLTDKKSLEQLIGFEYQSDCKCWSSSLVYQRYVIDYNKTKNAVFFQLRLRGLGGLGINPRQELRRSIPGYSTISEERR